MTAVRGARALVTGGASGIGLGIATELLAAGAEVAVVDIASEAIETAVADLGRSTGGRVRGFRADVSFLADVERVRDEVESELGPVDILVNNAGVAFNSAPVWETPPAMVDWCYGVNVMGVYHGLRCFLPGMLGRGHGHVVNTSSIGGFQVRRHPLWHQGLYASTKYAVVALTEGLAHDLADTDIGVSVLAPAWVATDIAHSDRNRPARFGGPAQGSQRPETAAVMANDGMDPRVVGRLVVHAVTRNQLYVFTHPEQREVVAERHAAVMRGFDQADSYFGRRTGTADPS
ncbi:SDR family oxidoreductase [Streptomyces malaysiensis]|uniref:SDR family oxidoreductase n=1 Tax=Streptomyces malaysiensis TaxID=92644 RepID=UPI002B3031B0|nr:SDR family NAD(P)-dependent oxidoreductase [Streptomyces malaysiensis]